MKKYFIYKNFFLQDNYSFIFYIENNNYMSYSISSLRKYKNINNYFVSILKNEIILNTSIFNINKEIKKNQILLENSYNYKKLKYFKEFFYENKAKLKIVGRGWKIIKYNYQLLIKLGYSHMIFFNLSPMFKHKVKKKKKNIIYFMEIFIIY